MRCRSSIGRPGDCSVAQNVFATVIAFDQRAFPGVKPSRVEDFFDLERLPDKRALEKNPDVILEWALLAEGAPASQVYDLLSTDLGLRLALRKLDTIRDQILWWEEVARPAEMLRDGEVSMASGYNGRFFSMAREEGAPVVIVWNGRVIGYDVWAVLATSKQPRLAERFLRFATAQLARLAERIPYGPAHNSAMNLAPPDRAASKKTYGPAHNSAMNLAGRAPRPTSRCRPICRTPRSTATACSSATAPGMPIPKPCADAVSMPGWPPARGG